MIEHAEFNNLSIIQLIQKIRTLNPGLKTSTGKQEKSLNSRIINRQKANYSSMEYIENKQVNLCFVYLQNLVQMFTCSSSIIELLGVNDDVESCLFYYICDVNRDGAQLVLMFRIKHRSRRLAACTQYTVSFLHRIIIFI